MSSHGSVRQAIDPQLEAQGALRDLINKFAILILTLGSLAAAVSVTRITSDLLLPNVVVDISFYSLAVFIVLLRKKLQVTRTMTALVVLVAIISIANFITLGLANTSFLMLACCAIITGVVFGARAGFMYLFGTGSAVLVTGLAMYMRWIPTVRVAPEYLHQPQTWALQITIYILFTIIMLVTVGSVQKRLYRFVAQLTRQSQEIEESERKHRLLTENMQDVIFAQDMEMNITYSSPAVEKVFGYTPEETLSLKMSQIMTPDSLKYTMDKFGGIAELARTDRNLEIPPLELEYIRKDGSTFWGEIRPAFVRDREGDLIGSQGILHDISDRKAAEQKLKDAVSEKEVLLRELYHRTKNNMQVIASMLSLQAGYVKEERVRDIFTDVQHRIRAMSLVHEKLYQSGNLASINFRDYVTDLVNILVSSYRRADRSVDVSVDVEDLSVSLDAVIPCGLILNELITNALKHGLAGTPDGRLSVHASRKVNGEAVIRVADNGTGFPDGFDPAGADTFGLKIVRGIAEHQLQGTVEFTGKDGVTCTVRFTEQPETRV